MTERFAVTYHVRSDAASIEARAQAIAVEQSVEMPLAAIDEPAVLSDIVGKVDPARRDGALLARRVWDSRGRPTLEVLGPHRSRTDDSRRRSRTVSEHGVRQYIVA